MDETGIKFCIALAASVGLSGIYWVFNKYKRRQINFTDKELSRYPWKPVGTVKSLLIYPIKSCRGISLTKYCARKEGPAAAQFRDRSFVIVDRQNILVTGRERPALLKIKPLLNLEDNSMTLTYNGMDPLILNLQLVEALGNPCVVTIWDKPVPGVDCGDEAAQWLSSTIGIGYRLVYHRDNVTKRIPDEGPEFQYVMKTDGALYADCFPYLLMTTASLDDLNGRAGEDFPYQNFRPNLLIENDAAFAEDGWTYLRIAGVHFRNTKHCDRCVFTTINHETAERSANLEPLKTLKKFRTGRNGHCRFGINLALYNSDEEEGMVSVGDVVYASTCPRKGE